jgi:dolichol kinase
VFFISATAIGYYFCQSFIVLIFAVILTFAEAMSDKGIDNLILPIVSAILILTVAA